MNVRRVIESAVLRSAVRWATYHVAASVGLGGVLLVLAFVYLFGGRRSRRVGWSARSGRKVDRDWQRARGRR